MDRWLMAVVIFGPMASGKTYHASRFMQHYGCTRIVEADPRVREPIRDDDLILTNQGYVDAKHRFSEARIVPVDEARIAIGLNPAPNGGFRPPYDQAPGWRASADPRIKTATGPTILLQSGAYFDLLDPHSSDINIDDIAHGLSNICRFAGQCSHFYSVAEHSVHTSYLVPPALALTALMHDAAEAYLGDVTRPLKSLLPAYKAIERDVEAAIGARFGIADFDAPEIKRADLEMLAAEQAALMPPHADDWACLAGVRPAPLNFRLWNPAEAKLQFVARFTVLMKRSR